MSFGDLAGLFLRAAFSAERTRSTNAGTDAPRRCIVSPVIVHLIDGTYELFRHYYGIRRWTETPPAMSAVAGVLQTVAQMLDDGATHIAVATDHVVESFRNDLWPGYKTGQGLDPLLWAQFHPLERALAAMGVVTWPMVEVEADDALASAAYLASRDPGVQKVCIWTPDKDLAQCVVGDRVVQVVRRSGEIRGEEAVRGKFGVPPAHIPDFLALVGDAADGYPGIPRFGAKTTAKAIARYGPIEQFPEAVLGHYREHALLFKQLATLRTDLALFDEVEQLRWTGPAPDFGEVAEEIGATHLTARLHVTAHGAAKAP